MSGRDTIPQQLIKYIESAYGDKPEFLWESFDSAIWRNQRNRKWYGIIMSIKKSKLGIDEDPDAEIDVLNVRLTAEETAMLVDNCRFFPGYHMNKRYWLTVLLDGTVEFAQIMQLVDASYQLIDSKS